MADPSELTDQLAAAAKAVIRVAHALVAAGRQIDLRGLDDEAGRLCAAVLDLEPGQGRAMRPKLAELLSETESLRAALDAWHRDRA